MKIVVEQVLNFEKRINKDGENCNIGDIITWSMRKNKEQLFGIIKRKHKTCVYVDLLDYSIYDHKFYLKKIRKIDNVCYNKLLYSRKLMIVNTI